jgi:hypothetical protein
LDEIDALREPGDSVVRSAALEQARSAIDGELEGLAASIDGVAAQERAIRGDVLAGLRRELADAFGGLIEGTAGNWGGAGMGGPSRERWRSTWVGGDPAVWRDEDGGVVSAWVVGRGDVRGDR